jgi:rhodanese-related sulfurtransferase
MKIKKISREAIVRKLEDKEPVLLVEALPEMYFRKEHLPGAMNIPHDAIERLAPELIPNKQASIVVYCASLTCENSTIAAQTLLQMGYTDVSEYEAGKQDWKDAGLALATDRQ